ILFAGVLLAPVLIANSYGGGTLPMSRFDEQLSSMRSEYSVYSQQTLDSAGKSGSQDKASRPKHLSPAKAFAMSLVVPGLGQFYNGSKVKAAGFFALDVAAWALNFKYRADGRDATATFEKFQQDNWKRTRYEDQYLLWVYGKNDDDSITATEVSHHLPDQPTQQYYEMTGKYDQFAWGWVDATYQGKPIDSFSATSPMDSINVNHPAPTSNLRFQYETMRHEANKKFDAADRWVMVALANHLISAFDALLTAKRKNNQGGAGEFGRVKIKADLRTIYAYRDTPYLRCSYAF
ncbi:MAG: hypothetical protein HY851_12365, partial [candidate division Zixibacteria bacterium]|nr:hypothetical protein [candidate division Zixibacteria bacterium]